MMRIDKNFFSLPCSCNVMVFRNWKYMLYSDVLKYWTFTAN